jgi:hypothetical protein
MNIIDISGNKKIAISGAHKVGKTVLCERIIKEFKYKTLIQEAARDLIYNTNRKTNYLNYSYLLQLAILYSHLFLIHTNNEFISDRSIFDVVAYTDYVYKEGYLKLIEFEEIKEGAVNTILNSREYYDLILFYNMHNSYTTYTTKYQETVQFNMLNLLSAYRTKGVDFFIIEKGDVIKYKDKEIII